MNFIEFKTKILAQAKIANACSNEYKRAEKSKTIEEFIEVLKDNLSFAKDNNILTLEMSKEYEKPELFNIGKYNTGFFNSGDQNSGSQNSGYKNIGDQNSGHKNNGSQNSGDQNIGYKNSGDQNSGSQNSGYKNIGDQNSGHKNNGSQNSGDLNSGYRNSGVFCTRQRTDTISFFNHESKMIWDEWYNHPAYIFSSNLEVTKWISWDNMNEYEKKENPKASFCGGYIKVFDYHTAWRNLWNTLNETQKSSFKTLPNFDSVIFKEITGIDI